MKIVTIYRPMSYPLKFLSCAIANKNDYIQFCYQPDNGSEEIIDNSDKIGGMNYKQGFHILLISAIKDLKILI